MKRKMIVRKDSTSSVIKSKPAPTSTPNKSMAAKRRIRNSRTK